MSGIWRELQRRNILRAVILYVTSVWALTQGIAALEPVVGAPEWVARWFLVAALIGLPFWIAFAWFYELTPQGIRRDSEAGPSESVARATGRRLDFWIIGVLVAAVVLLLTDRFVSRGNPPATGPVISEKSVAVLPLVNDSGDANALYFSDGLSEGFINALSQFAGLKVIGRVSSFQFRDSKDPVAIIGAKLGVAHLLEGSVQRAGDVVRISAELIDTKDGTAIWSEHYDRPFTDLFKLQDDITNAVASALKAKLLGESTMPQTDRPASGNVDAYNAYLQGEFYRPRTTEADFHKAIDAFGAAIRLDPHYAQAYAGLSGAWTDLAGNLGGAAQQQAYAQARKAADTALELAPDLAVAHNAQGYVLLAADSSWASAEAQFRRALQLDPNNVTAKANLALVLASVGSTEQAVDLTRQALSADPLRAVLYFGLANYLLPLGRLDEAERAIRKAIELQPAAVANHEVLTMIEIQRGDAEAALSAARAEPPGAWQDVAVTLALQVGADRAAADAALNALIAKHGNDAPFQIAESYAIRKDADKMFDWLSRAQTLNDPGLQTLLYDPFILLYRHDARFAALCEQMKLPVPKA